MTDDATRSSASSAQNTNSHPDDSSTTIYTHERNTRDQGLSDETTESTSTETPSTNQHKLLNYYRERFPSFDLQSGEPANKSEERGMSTLPATETTSSENANTQSLSDYEGSQTEQGSSSCRDELGSLKQKPDLTQAGRISSKISRAWGKYIRR